MKRVPESLFLRRHQLQFHYTSGPRAPGRGQKVILCLPIRGWVALRRRDTFVNLSVTTLAIDRSSLEPHLSSILFPNVAPSPSAKAQGTQQNQDNASDGRSDSDKDCLVPLEPPREAVISLLDIRWTGGSEILQESLTASRIDPLQPDLNKIIMSLSDFRGR